MTLCGDCAIGAQAEGVVADHLHHPAVGIHRPQAGAQVALQRQQQRRWRAGARIAVRPVLLADQPGAGGARAGAPMEEAARGAGGACAKVDRAAGKLAFTTLFVAKDNLFMLGMGRFHAQTSLSGCRYPRCPPTIPPAPTKRPIGFVAHARGKEE